MALHWPQKEWFANMARLVEDLFRLPMLWNLLVQSHVKKFHRGLGNCPFSIETIKQLIHKAGFFLKRLQRSSLQTIRESSTDSSTGVVGVSPCKTAVQQKAEFFLYLHCSCDKEL